MEVCLSVIIALTALIVSAQDTDVSWKWRCSLEFGKSCVPCDGKPDCFDLSDELNCGNGSITNCLLPQGLCQRHCGIRNHENADKTPKQDELVLPEFFPPPPLPPFALCDSSHVTTTTTRETTASLTGTTTPRSTGITDSTRSTSPHTSPSEESTVPGVPSSAVPPITTAQTFQTAQSTTPTTAIPATGTTSLPPRPTHPPTTLSYDTTGKLTTVISTTVKPTTVKPTTVIPSTVKPTTVIPTPALVPTPTATLAWSNSVLWCHYAYGNYPMVYKVECICNVVFLAPPESIARHLCFNYVTSPDRWTNMFPTRAPPTFPPANSHTLPDIWYWMIPLLLEM